MKVGIPKESFPGESRVAVIPETVKQFVERGIKVSVEAGAGALADFVDAQYKEAGAGIEKSHDKLLAGSDMVLMIQRPSDKEVAKMRQGAALITFLQPFSNPGLLKKLAARKISAMSMEMVPRISRAQNMDALSSMATVAGYKAVLLAANAFHRFFPMFMTAAGTIAPARALVLGAGVAGLQAIATAKRLGAIVEAFDTRPVVKEQVESLGARFVALDVSQEEAEDQGGYAKQLSADHYKKELELIAGRLTRTDIVITTAQIPGKPAPLLITEKMVKQMKTGSVVVDLAAESGGNCALTQAGKTVVKHGVTMIGTTNLPGMMPVHASQMYSKNIGNLVLHLVGEDGLTLNFDDPITAGVVVTHGGKLIHPALMGG
ncbi:MAG: Re/Si-specific NAD(P)(+) transhydrogenase subunit alpha [SAR324 cluster bacterium]|nr:Re/Si-specific NAD(P)(+) transhydrogenase subunit alpha [SAR324 cluster bacterium]